MPRVYQNPSNESMSPDPLEFFEAKGVPVKAQRALQVRNRNGRRDSTKCGHV